MTKPALNLAPEETKAPLRYLNNRMVRARYADMSEMTLWRRMRDGEFPRPDRVINRIRYWREDRLDTFDAEKEKRHEAQR